ncbi:MAG: HYR domain-containing protein [Flavobacteriales bacterium]|nr:HYR domain-containing protein [Flavobacteriales bacterium]
MIEVEASCTTPVLTSGAGTTASGSSFPVGTTIVSYQSTDAAGNSSNCNFNVVVTDATPPTFGATPSMLGYVPSNACTITAPNYPTPTDNCPGVIVQYVSGPNPGDALAPGSYQMKYRALDAAGLFSAEQTLNVTVQDTIKPTITSCPSGVNVGTTVGLCTGVASWNAPSVSDNCTGSTIMQTAGPVSGSAFPTGTTTITYTATDAYANTATCSFNVNVVDSEPATITCPSDTTIDQQPGQCTGNYMYAVPVINDNCGGPWSALFMGGLAPGDFPVGTTTNTYTGSVGGTTLTCEFDVTVLDLEDPSIIPPANVLASTNSGCTATGVALGTPVTADNCGVATVSNDAPASFPVGTTNVTWTVTDNAGRQATSTQTVTVSDMQAPLVTCPGAVVVNAAPGACNAIASFNATATDNCGASPSITYSLNPGTVFPVGVTTVTVTATDGLNVSAPCTFTVTVNAAVVDLNYPVTTICKNSAPILPSTIIPAINTGGVFSDANQTGTINAITGAFNPAVATPGLHTLGYVFAGACTSHDWFTINVLPSTTNTTIASSCDSYVWAVNGQSYSASGTYSEVSGCNTAVLVLSITGIDDNDACTLDACVNGVAVHTPVDVDDNDACTIDACVNGVAVHTPVDVDDNDACTLDACVNGVAVHACECG